MNNTNSLQPFNNGNSLLESQLRLPLAPSLAEFLEQPSMFRPRDEFLNSTTIEDETVLTHCVKTQNAEAVKSLILAGVDVNQPSRKGVTPISAAAHKGNIAIMQFLIDAGAAVNAINQSGSTALIQASHFGHLDAVNLLIKYNAAADFANVKGTTALMRASQEGHVEISKSLIRADVDVNRKNHEGMNALMLSSQRGHAEIVVLLINSGATMDEQTSQGSTALMLACKRGHEKCAEVLISMGAEIFIRDRRGRTARDTATRRNHYGLLCWLDTQVQVMRIQEGRLRQRAVLLKQLRDNFMKGRASLAPTEMMVHQILSAIRANVSIAREKGTSILQYIQQECDMNEAMESASNLLLTTSSNSDEDQAKRMLSKNDYEFSFAENIVRYNYTLQSFVNSAGWLPVVSRNPLFTIQYIASLHSPIQQNISATTTLSGVGRHYGVQIAKQYPAYSDWQWSSILYRCLCLPAGLFELIADFMPLPRVWQWSLIKLKRRCKLAPHQAMIDISTLIDEILNDANIFYGPFSGSSLIKLSRNPQIHSFLVEQLGMPESLLESLCTWSDIQSILHRSNEVEISLKATMAKQMLQIAIGLYRWHRLRTNAGKALHLSFAPSLSNMDLLNNTTLTSNSLRRSESDILAKLAASGEENDMMEATDAGGEEEEDGSDDNDGDEDVVAMDQDTENEIGVNEGVNGNDVMLDDSDEDDDDNEANNTFGSHAY